MTIFMSKFTLSTYLMLSVVVILSGITWVILTQTSDRYGAIEDFSELKAEQDEILRQYYQLQDKYLPKEKQAEPLHKVLGTQLVTSADVNTAAKLPQRDDNTASPGTTRLSHDNSAATGSNDFLRNNPWSADYQPGY